MPDGVALEPPTSVALYTRACEGKEPLGCKSLAVMLANGLGTKLDVARALTLFESACAAGNHEACTELAVRQINGAGIARPPSSMPSQSKPPPL